METKLGARLLRLFPTIIPTCILAGGLWAVEPPASKPALLLADVWDESIDPTGWWISEKYDGMRGYWTGEELRMRGGGLVQAPEYFLKELPEGVALDGELWLGRGRFEETVSIVRRHEPDERWRNVKFMVFDAPDHEGAFERRMDYLQKILPANARHVMPVPQYRCQGTRHLLAARDRIVKAGGEGLMLRKPESGYERRRSSTLLKVKPYDDAEAVVIAHLPGKGRNEGRLGSLRVRAPDGREFSIGTGFSDAQRESPPPVGTTVTYRFRGLTRKGLPRFPSFLRVRVDAGGAEGSE